MASVDLRNAVKRIFTKALQAVDPEEAVRRFLAEEFSPPGKVSRIWLAGFGKAGVPMARAVEDTLEDRLIGGIITVKDGHAGRLNKTRVYEASHPEPDQRGVEAASQITSFLKSNLQADDLLILVISGGGSALFPMPVKGITLEDKQTTTSALIRCGATIQEINTIRKHLSQVKGGRLLDFTNGANILSLVLSDVIDDDFSSIASGPTSGDPTTFADCCSIIEKYGIEPVLAPRVVEYLKRGKEKREESPSETPKPYDKRFQKVRNVLIANNFKGLAAAAQEAQRQGFQPLILSSSIAGDTREVAGMHVAIASEIIRTGNPVRPPCCVISGGETTVKVEGDGQGGRNMEFTLHCSHLIRDWGRLPILFASLGSDGTDGPTDAAGALAEVSSVQRSRILGMDIEDFARRNDSYNYFKDLGDLIVTGPTQTNVMDFRFILIDAPV